MPKEAWAPEQRKWVEIKFREIQKDVALAHWLYIQKDQSGEIGRLSPEQITKYHHSVFTKHGLPSTTFAGTIFGGGDFNHLGNQFILNRGWWCSKCDEFK